MSGRRDLLLHHVIIDEGRHEGDGKGVWALPEHLGNRLVLQTNNILAIDFSKAVIYQDSIPVGRREGVIVWCTGQSDN
jgi:hypothetical protein